MAFHDAYEHHEKEAIHGKMIQPDAVSEHNLFVATNRSLLATKLMAPVINPQHNPTYAILDNGCTRSMGSWHAIQRFTQAIKPMKDIISYQYIPAETKFTFANGETARVNWTLHLRYHTTPPCSTNIDVLEQGTVPILLSISQMRNLYMTIEHTPQCDKITCKAFSMNRQAVPVSGAGHALVDLAGVARVKAHGEIAHKAIQIKQLSKQAFQEARQSEDIRRDLAQNLRMSSKPLQVKDKVFYWQEDKSKIRSDGSKGGILLKGKVISIEGAMVGLDLGT